MNHAGPLRGRSSPAHLQPQGTSTAGRPSRCSWPSRVGGSCPCDPQCGLPTQNAKRFEQANPRPRPTPPATVLGSRGVAGGRAASAPRCSRPPLAPFAAEGTLPGKHAHGLRRWAGCAWVQQQNHGRLRRPSGLATARLPLEGKGKRRRRSAAGLAHRRKRVKHWGWTNSLALQWNALPTSC